MPFLMGARLVVLRGTCMIAKESHTEGPMIKAVLAASDLSTRSKPAIWAGVRLARRTGAKLTAVHVVEDDQPDTRMREEMRSAKEFLADQIASFSEKIDFDVRSLPGSAFQEISAVADEVHADLIVVGAHRRKLLKDIFVGTTAERVMRHTRRPVLMASSKTGETWRKVMVALDLSAISAHAAETVARMGLLDGVNVSFVHVHVPIVRSMMADAGIDAQRVNEEAERDVAATQRSLAQFLQELDLGGCTYSTRVLEGEPVSAIAQSVGTWQPDLLVVGTRGKAGLRRTFMGSVAQELISRLDIDILAVPPGE